MATITAASEGKNGTAAITVTYPTPVPEPADLAVRIGYSALAPGARRRLAERIVRVVYQHFRPRNTARLEQAVHARAARSA